MLELLPGCPARFPLRPDRPSQSRYFIPAAADRERFAERELPLFAYLDTSVVDVAEASCTDVRFYDLVAGDEFIIGPVPGVDSVFTRAGWRGIGYNFAPWAGLVLA